MADDDIFDSTYVGSPSTEREKSESEQEKFLKEPIKEEEIKKYGTSKPRRLIIKGKISGR